MNTCAGCRISAGTSPVLFPIHFLDLWSAINYQNSYTQGYMSYEASTHRHILHKGCPRAQTPYHKDTGTWRYKLHAFLSSTLNVTTGRCQGNFASQVALRTGLGYKRQLMPCSPSTLNNIPNTPSLHSLCYTLCSNLLLTGDSLPTSKFRSIVMQTTANHEL
jgi:hypothetical protein